MHLVPWMTDSSGGATMEDAGFDERTTVAGVRNLLEAACEIAPGAWAAGFIEARAGLRPASIDLLPIIGPSWVLPNLMYATAHYRNGILLAPVTAAMVADAMLDNLIDPALAAVSPQRFDLLELSTPTSARAIRAPHIGRFVGTVVLPGRRDGSQSRCRKIRSAPLISHGRNRTMASCRAFERADTGDFRSVPCRARQPMRPPPCLRFWLVAARACRSARGALQRRSAFHARLPAAPCQPH